jgi:monoamine oxidase
MTAYLLQKLSDRPLQITLFEASYRVGGKIRTPKFQTLSASYEAGAAEFYDYTPVDDDPLKELIFELGLSISSMNGSAVIVDNHLIANLDDIENQFGPQTRAACTEFDQNARDTMSPREFYESDIVADANTDVTMQSSLRFDSFLAKIAEPATQRLIEVQIHSDLATEPSKTSISYGLQNYLMNHPSYMRLYSITGGNEQLPQELARRTRMKKRLRHRVTRIERGASGFLQVTSTCEGVTHQEEFDFVVAALPLDAIPSIEFRGDRLQQAMRQHHSQYNHPAHYLRMTLLFDRPFWRGTLLESFCMLDKFHGCCLYDETLRDPGARHGVLGWLVGGQDAEELSFLSDEELIERALKSLPDSLADGRQYFLEGRVHRWIGAVNALPGGVIPQNQDRRHQPEPVHHPDFLVVGDYLFDSTLNGVLDSAEYVASWIAATLAEISPAP